MIISIFLAKVLGLYLVIMSLAMFINIARIKDIINEIDRNPALLMISGAMALIFGILLVVSHNIWEFNWRIIITIIAWMSFIKGFVRLIFPDFAKKFDLIFIKNNISWYITSAVVLLIGAYLLLIGFQAF